MEELTNMACHPTADEVYQRVRTKIKNISLGTVYRNLEVLSSEGVIQIVENAGSNMRFDHNIDKHYHVRCINCGKVGDVFINENSLIDRIAEIRSAYKILDHNLEFTGFCQACQIREKSPDKNHLQEDINE